MYEDKTSWRTVSCYKHLCCLSVSCQVHHSCPLRIHNMTHTYSYIQYNTCHVGSTLHDSYISCYIHRLTTDSDYLTHVWIIIRTYQDSYVTHVTYNAWLVFDSCYVHNTTLLAYDSSGHLNNLTPLWFTSRSQHDS